MFIAELPRELLNNCIFTKLDLVSFDKFKQVCKAFLSLAQKVPMKVLYPYRFKYRETELDLGKIRNLDLTGDQLLRIYAHYFTIPVIAPPKVNYNSVLALVPVIETKKTILEKINYHSPSFEVGDSYACFFNADYKYVRIILTGKDTKKWCFLERVDSIIDLLFCAQHPYMIAPNLIILHASAKKFEEIKNCVKVISCKRILSDTNRYAIFTLDIYRTFKTLLLDDYKVTFYNPKDRPIG